MFHIRLAALISTSMHIRVVAQTSRRVHVGVFPIRGKEEECKRILRVDFLARMFPFAELRKHTRTLHYQTFGFQKLVSVNVGLVCYWFAFAFMPFSIHSLGANWTPLHTHTHTH